MKDIILFGIQGCGKGTQAQKIMEKYADVYSYLSTGVFFRAIGNHEDNPIGKYVVERINKGEYIPDAITIPVFHMYFHTLAGKRMLLDGYPRSISQINDLLQVFKKEKRACVGINFVLSEEKAIARMLERNREDDTREGIAKRLEQYYSMTQPVIDYFASHAKLVNIQADDTIENIYAQVDQIIQS